LFFKIIKLQKQQSLFSVILTTDEINSSNRESHGVYNHFRHD